jgi:hypothetical protein
MVCREHSQLDYYYSPCDAYARGNGRIIKNDWRKKCESKGTSNSLLCGCIDDNGYAVNSHYREFINLEPLLIGHLSWDNVACKRWNPEGFELREESCLMLLTSIRFSIRLNQLRYYFKHELAGEAHGHFLIFKRGVETVNPKLLADGIRSTWVDGWSNKPTVDKIKRGRAVVEVITDIKDAVSYVCKVEFDERWNRLDTVDVLSPKLKTEIIRMNSRPLT